MAWHRQIFGGHFSEAQITVTDFANIVVGTTITITKSDDTEVVFTSEAISGSAPSSSLGFRPNESNDTTADNIFTAVNAHADFTVANPSAAIVTVFETTPAGTGLLTIESSDTVRLTTTDEKESKVKSVSSISETLENQVWIVIERIINSASNKALRCVEIAGGSPLTADEISATKKSEINRECPSIANPNYVPYNN